MFCFFPNSEPQQDEERRTPLSRGQQVELQQPEAVFAGPSALVLLRETGDCTHLSPFNIESIKSYIFYIGHGTYTNIQKQHSFQYFLRKLKLYTLRICSCFPLLKNYILQIEYDKNTIIIKESLLYGKNLRYILWFLIHKTSVIKEKIN